MRASVAWANCAKCLSPQLQREVGSREIGVFIEFMHSVRHCDPATKVLLK